MLIEQGILLQCSYLPDSSFIFPIVFMQTWELTDSLLPESNTRSIFLQFFYYFIKKNH